MLPNRPSYGVLLAASVMLCMSATMMVSKRPPPPPTSEDDPRGRIETCRRCHDREGAR